MKKVIVTGATSGIGKAITKLLIKHGFYVIGIGRNFSKIDFKDNFERIECDLTKLNEIEQLSKKIKNRGVEILINSAGIGYFGPHEEINTKKLHELISLNLEAPILLSHLLLRELKKRDGIIINISSITAKKSSVFGCAYSATKAGLSHFSRGLFDEVRKTGVKVITIHPDITKTPFYDNLNFCEAEEKLSYLTPETVANAVLYILSQPKEVVITDITLQPQKHMIKRK